MCDYPFFIPQVVLFANSSLFWFKVTNEHREFRNYLLHSYRRLRNATSRINTAFFVTYKQITPHRIWYNRVD